MRSLKPSLVLVALLLLGVLTIAAAEAGKEPDPLAKVNKLAADFMKEVKGEKNKPKRKPTEAVEPSVEAVEAVESQESETEAAVHQVNAAAEADIAGNGLVVGVGRDITQIKKPVVVFGKEGSHNGEFWQPWRAALLSTGEIAVVDSANHRLSVWTRNGQFVRHIGEQGTLKGEFTRPRDISPLNNGSFLLVDRFNNRIQTLSPSGVPLYSFSAEEALSVAEAKNGDIIVSETHWDQVHIYDDHGKFNRKLMVVDGEESVSLEDVQGITVTKDGDILLADSSHHRIFLTTPKGKVIKKFGSAGSKQGQFDFPYDIDVAPDGKIFVVDFGNHRIQVLSPELEFLYSFGKEGQSAGQFFYPTGVLVTPDYQIIVVEMGNHRVQIF